MRTKRVLEGLPDAVGKGMMVRALVGLTLLGVLLASTPIDAQSWSGSNCGNCHPIDTLFSHPINMVPSMQVPEQFPLDSGQVTCPTCHQGEQASSHAQARANHTPLLRGRGASGGQSFCRQCHSANGSSRSAQHSRSLGLAHLAWPASKSPMGSRPARQLADQSQLCMGCHDGSLAPEAGGMQMGSGFSELGQAQSGHPVPVPYRETRESHLKPAASLDGRIHLFNGQVGCTSCHSPFSREKGLLVISNQKSKLCVACHGR